MSTKIKLWYR